MNHCCSCAVIVRDIEVGVVAFHMICKMRMAVEEYNVMILLKKLSETSFVLVAFKVRDRIEETPIVVYVALAEERVAFGSIEEGVEIEVNSLVLVFLKHCLKPILLFVSYDLNKRNISVFNLAKENEYIAISFFA